MSTNAGTAIAFLLFPSGQPTNPSFPTWNKTTAQIATAANRKTQTMSTTISKTVSRTSIFRNTFRKTTLALLASMSLIAVSTASAGQPQVLLLNPGHNHGPICHDLPRFGFTSFNFHGFGEQVTSVRWGGIASRMGLERGDVILSLNGFPLSYQGSWSDALREAVNNGGWVQLTVRDVRTGIIATRQTFVGDGGPIVPHSHVTNYYGHGPVTPKMKTMPYHQPQQNMNNVEQIKKIVDLFDKTKNP
jgi:hypothetical protein